MALVNKRIELLIFIVLFEYIVYHSRYDAQTGQHNLLEDISMIGIATMDTGVNQTLSKKFLSRFNITVVPDPSEDSFSKIFSTTLGLEFKVGFKMYLVETNFYKCILNFLLIIFFA